MQDAIWVGNWSHTSESKRDMSPQCTLNSPDSSFHGRNTQAQCSGRAPGIEDNKFYLTAESLGCGYNSNN